MLLFVRYIVIEVHKSSRGGDMKIQEIRQKTGLTQVEAAKKLNITKDYLSMIETGKRRCSFNLINLMAELYNEKPEIIFLAINRTYCSKSVT